MVSCPFHTGDICSLCCGLEVRCSDMCRPQATVEAQSEDFAARFLPTRIARFALSRYGRFAVVFGAFVALIGLVLLLVHRQVAIGAPEAEALMTRALGLAFGLLVLMAGVAAWLQTLARESRLLADEERERQTRRLMAEVRAHQRTDAELQRARDRAEAANDAKSRYVAGMSHELRSPLNAILGYAQLLEHDPTIPAARRPALRVIRRSSEHLADLIESLLDISKIEAGHLEINRTEVGLRDVIEQVAATFCMEAEEKGIAFHLDKDRRIPERVHADARRLRQILMNLLSNAVRYTDRGEVTFAIAYRSDIATFTVRDTGRGIPPEAAERIFEPFVRIEDPKAPVPGTGLGLTISRLLVELLGGELVFDSAPGKGSTFTLRLMLPHLGQSAPQEAKRRIYGYRGPRRRILIVDDNAEHRTLLEDALRPVGFELILAESGPVALSLAGAAEPDLVMIDVAMPGMNGWALAQKLRCELVLAAPILMISAHAAEQQANLAQTHAVPGHHDDFLAKPVDMDTLFLRIERLLRLDWVLDEPVADCPAHPIVGPDIDLGLLADAVSIGHVRGAERALATLSGSAPEAAAFCVEARRLLDRLDLAGLERLIAEVRHERP
jgi:signal transduction histidine kinase/ActR/RegA family two-component response regulator